MTKTAEGFHKPTNPNRVEIRASLPERPFVELGTVTTTGWGADEEAKMHNALRNKTAKMGAHAVVLAHSGVIGDNIWTKGVAIRYTGPAKKKTQD